MTIYGLALAALANVGEISGLRETSIAFAALIRGLLLGERFGVLRATATAPVAASTVGMKLISVAG